MQMELGPAEQLEQLPNGLLPLKKGRDEVEQLPRSLRRIEVFLCYVSGICLVSLMLMVTADVLSRKFLMSSIPGVLEITGILVVIIAASGMTTAAAMGQHVRVQILTSRVSRLSTIALRLIGLVASLVIAAWMIYATTVRGLESFKIGEFQLGVVAVPVWPARIAIVFGLAGLAAIIAFELVATIRGREPETLQANPLAE